AEQSCCERWPRRGEDRERAPDEPEPAAEQRLLRLVLPPSDERERARRHAGDQARPWARAEHSGEHARHQTTRRRPQHSPAPRGVEREVVALTRGARLREGLAAGLVER